MKTEKITRPSQLKDGDVVNVAWFCNPIGSYIAPTVYKNCDIFTYRNNMCAIHGSGRNIILSESLARDCFHFGIIEVERIIPEPKITTEPINDAIESINVDFKNNVVTTVYVGEKPKKNRYFTDGCTIAKNPKVKGERIEFESHICLNVYSKGGWLPINEYTVNWCKASKKQRKEFKRVEPCQ